MRTFKKIRHSQKRTALYCASLFNNFHHRCPDMAIPQCTAGIQTTGHTLSQQAHFTNQSTKERHTSSVPLICLCKGPRLAHKASLCQKEVEWKYGSSMWKHIWLFTHLGWIQNTAWPGTVRLWGIGYARTQHWPIDQVLVQQYRLSNWRDVYFAAIMPCTDCQHIYGSKNVQYNRKKSVCLTNTLYLSKQEIIYLTSFTISKPILLST